MPKLLALFQRMRQIVADEPELRQAAEDGLEELVELLQFRHDTLRAERGPQTAKIDGETRLDTQEFIRKQVIKKTASSHIRPGGSSGDLQVMGQFTQEVVRPTQGADASSKEDATEGAPPTQASPGDPAKQRERRRRDSDKFLELAADRTIFTGMLASTKEDSVSMIQQFKEGFIHFKNEVILQHSEYFRDLANAQHPTVMVIACCDSRVDPALLLGAGPGDIFIVRNIANLVPPFERQGNYHGTSAALEYAVRFLKVNHIMVIGHKNCGGVRALMSRADVKTYQNDFIDNWMEIAAQACERTKIECGSLTFDEQCAYCERESVNVSLTNLLTFPFIKQEIARKTLELHGWYYDLESAMMDTWQLRYQISDYERLV